MHAALGTRTPRLLVAVCAVVLLGSTLAVAPAAPARVSTGAGAAGTEGFVVLDHVVLGTSEATGERCDSGNSLPLVSDRLTGNGTTVRVSDAQTRTLTAPGDPDDTTRFSLRGSASGSVRQSGGAVRSFAAAASTSVSADSARGVDSDCDYQGIARADVFFDGPFEPGFLRFALVLSGAGGGASAFVDGPGFEDAAFLTSTNGEVTFDVHLDGGEHRVDISLDASVTRPDAESSLTRSTAALKVRGRTTGLGGAWGRATGAGRSQVRLAAARSCPAGTIATTLTRKVGNARTVVLQVDGKRRATIKRPRPGRTVVVRRARAGSGVTVSAAITRPGGRLLTTEREYAPCRG